MFVEFISRPKPGVRGEMQTINYNLTNLIL